MEVTKMIGVVGDAVVAWHKSREVTSMAIHFPVRISVHIHERSGASRGGGQGRYTIERARECTSNVVVSASCRRKLKHISKPPTSAIAPPPKKNSPSTKAEKESIRTQKRTKKDNS